MTGAGDQLKFLFTWGFGSTKAAEPALERASHPSYPCFLSKPSPHHSANTHPASTDERIPMGISAGLQALITWS